MRENFCPMEIVLNINFLVGGKINIKPKISVAKPGRIRSIAAKARAAPHIIS